MSFKGVFLEGVEVVFIVITFGLNADNLTVAVVGASAALVVVVLAGLLLHRPLSAIPENTLKYGVGLMLASFGTYWAVEGLGVLRDSGASVVWPGQDWAILGLIACWFAVTRALVIGLSRSGPAVAMAAEEVLR